MTSRAWHIHFNGIVQGVGFRPFVFKLAHELQIRGWVNNSSQGLNIHAEGNNLELFFNRLVLEAPPLAKIKVAEYTPVACEGFEVFSIIKSEANSTPNVLISPDIATCRDCLEDIRTPENRRFAYPFTNCTNCGPRYTIIKELPYDRIHTTMSDFSMCIPCEVEYENPLDRRFHAQPVACEHCGPQVELINRNGDKFPGLGIEQLLQGSIIAIKGIGGFHLACDARNENAVKRLRERKERGAKPFALMVKNLNVAREWVEIAPEEELILTSTAAPILIVPRHKQRKGLTENITEHILDEVAPGIHTLGIMLPYTPLHHLLFEGTLDVLVMTSANISGKPLVFQNDQAIKELAHIADYFLVHNREIFHPCDDSVVQVIGETPVLMRRARGYVPLPIACPEAQKPLLATGGELKNSFCLAQGRQAFLSQYLGNMEGYENFERFLQEVESFKRVVNIYPSALGYDLHPNYQTTRYAKELDWPKIGIQHHHAHLVSVMGEHDVEEPTLGVICDGTGYGDDGKIWGFEFLYGNQKGYERKAHLEYLPLPGGDAGAKHPLRIAYAYAKTLLEDNDWPRTNTLWGRLTLEEQIILDRQLAQELQIFSTSSAGRLFDAVSALLGICIDVTYEGQAAIELESKATLWKRDYGHLELQAYPIDTLDYSEGPLILSIRRMFKEIIDDILNKRSNGEIAYKFHLGIAKAIVSTARLCLSDGDKTLVLNGGVFQNKLLSEMVIGLCRKVGIEILRAKELPPGDGGIAYGQILIANEGVKSCV